MRRLERFATTNGFLLAVEPSAERRAARFFGPSEYRDAVAWLGVPGADGFEVAQHVERVQSGGAEPSETRRRWTWAVFTLRQAGRSAEATLAAVSSMLPRRWGAELVESELFLMTTWPTSFASPRTWQMLREVQRTLHPVLAHPMRTSDAAERQRRGIQREISATDPRANRGRGASA